MARSLSDEKRQALLAAAIESIAAAGVGASTARIAKLAGVAEGTLFKYFPSKEALLNAVYLALKAEMGQSLLARFPSQGSVEARSRHVWTSYVRWGAAHPKKRRAMSQLAVSDVITEESRRIGSAGFQSLYDLIPHWRGLCVPSLKESGPGTFASAMLASTGDTTIDFIAKNPGKAKAYADVGFAAFWRAAKGS